MTLLPCMHESIRPRMGGLTDLVFWDLLDQPHSGHERLAGHIFWYCVSLYEYEGTRSCTFLLFHRLLSLVLLLIENNEFSFDFSTGHRFTIFMKAGIGSLQGSF